MLFLLISFGKTSSDCELTFTEFLAVTLFSISDFIFFHQHLKTNKKRKKLPKKNFFFILFIKIKIT